MADGQSLSIDVQFLRFFDNPIRSPDQSYRKRLAQSKTLLIALPSIVFMLGFLVIGVQADDFGGRMYQDVYPPPTDQSLIYSNYNFKSFLPLTRKPWQYLQVTAPPNSISVYIKTFANNTLYEAGCEQGTKDRNLGGTQNSIVFIHFGQPFYSGGQYGVRLLDTFEFKSTLDVANEVIQYAKGYWLCAGYDTQSKVTIAIGTSNDSDPYTTFEHGTAWGQMVVTAANLLNETSYKAQVKIAGASDMELGFNGPSATKNWVDGYINGVFDPNFGYQYRLYSVTDAAGCPPYGSCGTTSFPDWTEEDLWYISYGCHTCTPLPMIYENSWAHAEQWQSLSKYSNEVHGTKIYFSGTTTQFTACEQRRAFDPSCEFLDNTPEEGYKQLYTTLNSDPDTSQGLYWSTDMKWWGE